MRSAPYNRTYKKRGLPRAAGFSVIELLLGIFFLTFFLSGTLYLLVENVSAVVGSSDRFVAANLAQEGIEAAYSIRNADWCAARTGTHGLSASSGRWALSGSSDTQGRFTRTLTIEPVYRDNHVIVPAGSGALDDYTKKITATVSWTDTSNAQQSVQLVAYLTYWRKTRNGMLVFGNGGRTLDTISYRILNNLTSSWSAIQNTADVDPTTTDKALYAVQLYSSPTRDEKIMVSKHEASANLTKTTYAQVFNTCSGWGNVIQLASYVTSQSATMTDFSGTYLSNGDFMVVYSDFTTIPKFRVWDGMSWSAETAMVDTALNTSRPLNFIVAKARPGTKEVMTAFLDDAGNTNTQYFNGSSYATAGWTLHARHATTSPDTSQKMIDFDWSPADATKGALVFSQQLDDKKMHVKIWTADGAGGGSWSATADSPVQQDIIGVMTVKGRPTANEFIACHKSSNIAVGDEIVPPPKIICQRITFAPAWTVPANSIITASTVRGPQASFDVAFEDAETQGRDAIIVYSDGTTIPKLKKYNAVSQSWDLTPTSIGSVARLLETVRVVPLSRTRDSMILLANISQQLYSIVWNGDTNVLYTSPAAFRLLIQGTRGSQGDASWYDFAWDQF